MKKLYIFSLVFMLMLSSFVFADTSFVRTIPSSAESESQFEVTYTVSGIEQGGVLFTETVSGGCTFSSGATSVSSGWLMPGTPPTLTVNAPEDGSCTFSGVYHYADGDNIVEDVPMTGDSSVSINAVVDDCTYSSWGPDTSLVNFGDVFTQTRTVTSGTDCTDTSRTATGTMDCEEDNDCVYSAWSPLPDTINNGTSFTQTRTVTSGTDCTNTSRTNTGTKVTTTTTTTTPPPTTTTALPTLPITDPVVPPFESDNFLYVVFIIAIVVIVNILSKNQKTSTRKRK
jgi:hypothetical protein